MPATTTGIIHIETLCTPAKSNAVVSIGSIVPPMAVLEPVLISEIFIEQPGVV